MADDNGTAIAISNRALLVLMSLVSGLAGFAGGTTVPTVASPTNRALEFQLAEIEKKIDIKLDIIDRRLTSHLADFESERKDNTKRR